MGSKEIILNFWYSIILGIGLLMRFFAVIFCVVLTMNFLNCGL